MALQVLTKLKKAVMENTKDTVDVPAKYLDKATSLDHLQLE